MIALCKPESARFLTRECEAAGLRATPRTAGVVSIARPPHASVETSRLCYAAAVMSGEQTVDNAAGRALAEAAAACFCASARGRRFDGPWPLVAWRVDKDGIRRDAKMELAVREHIRPVMSRVARLATDEEPPGQTAHGLAIVCDSSGCGYVATECWFGGQRRMRDDPRAPSRSYLKIEEACRLFGSGPQAGETVADLGAAPGGWSYSAARRGAQVTAVDHGALKGAAADHELITHVRQDAFVFRPEPGRSFDWLFCDMVEAPSRILSQLEKWVTSGWCRRFVVNLKTGHVDPVAIVHALKSPDHPLRKVCSRLVCRELYHDREEVTVMGECGV